MALTRAQVREVDRRAIAEFGMSGLVLMENAGRGCVKVLARCNCRGPVAIVCGKGNNAGDGLVIARHLDLRRVPLKVLLIGPPQELTGDAAANHAILVKSGLPLVDFSGSFSAERLDAELAGCEWIVDALLGTGASGPPRPPYGEAIRRINAASARRLAVDLPSGLDCDTGIAAEPTIRADVTCTFVARKTGFDNPAARPFLGQVHVIDIGAPRKLLTEMLVEGRKSNVEGQR
jgi:NAD(P)H-hydrate epimerase